jgi:hypothetical protein
VEDPSDGASVHPDGGRMHKHHCLGGGWAPARLYCIDLGIRSRALTVCSRRHQSWSAESARHKNDLAHGTRCQELDGLSRFEEREGASNERVDLLFCEECEDLGQVLT